MSNPVRKENPPKEIPNRDNSSIEKAFQTNNIQDVFLNILRKERTIVTLFLMGGVKLTGKIKSFDKYAVILENNNQEQLIFKHAISTVVVSRTFHTATPHTSAAMAGSHM